MKLDLAEIAILLIILPIVIDILVALRYLFIKKSEQKLNQFKPLSDEQDFYLIPDFIDYCQYFSYACLIKMALDKKLKIREQNQELTVEIVDKDSLTKINKNILKGLGFDAEIFFNGLRIKQIDFYDSGDVNGVNGFSNYSIDAFNDTKNYLNSSFEILSNTKEFLDYRKEILNQKGYFNGQLPPKIKRLRNWLVVSLAISLFSIVGIFANMPLTVILMAFVVNKNKYSEQGWQLKNYLLGLKKYIKLPEAQQLEILRRNGIINQHKVNDNYQQLLPYAILFDQKQKWFDIIDKNLIKLDWYISDCKLADSIIFVEYDNDWDDDFDFDD